MAWLLKSPAGDANHDTPARLYLPNNRVMQLPAVGSVPLASVLGLPTVPWNLRLAASGCDENILLLSNVRVRGLLLFNTAIVVSSDPNCKVLAFSLETAIFN